MATWTPKITVLDVDKKTISLSATVVDGTFTGTYNVISAVVDNAAGKLAVMENIWRQYVSDVANNVAIDALASGLEDQAKAWLEGQVL